METPIHRYGSEIAFGETDASGWMHFPNVFRHVEKAEHEFLRSRGLLVFERDQGGWPRVRVSCDFKQPLLTGDRIEVLLEIAQLGNSSITWNFEVVKHSGELAAFGSMTNVRVNQFGQAQPISKAERKALQTTL